jgi:hypothetical protein
MQIELVWLPVQSFMQHSTILKAPQACILLFAQNSAYPAMQPRMHALCRPWPVSCIRSAHCSAQCRWAGGCNSPKDQVWAQFRYGPSTVAMAAAVTVAAGLLYTRTQGIAAPLYCSGALFAPGYCISELGQAKSVYCSWVLFTRITVARETLCGRCLVLYRESKDR